MDRDAARGTPLQRAAYVAMVERYKLAPFWFEFRRHFDAELAKLADSHPRYVEAFVQRLNGTVYREIGANLGVCQERARQMYFRALRMMACRMAPRRELTKKQGHARELDSMYERAKALSWSRLPPKTISTTFSHGAGI